MTSERLAAISESIIRVQIALADHFTPTLKRVAVQFEIFDAAVNRKWNRHQMIGDQGRSAARTAACSEPDLT